MIAMDLNFFQPSHRHDNASRNYGPVGTLEETIVTTSEQMTSKNLNHIIEVLL
jgi:hypothetical protein